jgi:hypothetical protein
LEDFLGLYGIQLHSSMPYAKGSTSAAESAISITKNALRQLCLSNPTDWPELLPTLLQAVNSTMLHGTTTSRAQLYFSPYSWQNSLRLNGLLFPEKLFSDTYEKLNHLIDKRKKILKKRHIMDKTNYFKGNLVFSTNVPSTKSNESGSAELNSTIEDIYYVEKVFERQLRLVGVFSGVRRVLPREMCTKISIDHLANLQIRLQSHQLQRLSDHMFKANKYMPPSSARTWQYLMDKKRKDLLSHEDVQLDPIPEPIDNDESQEISDPESSDNLGTTNLDVYGQSEDLQLPARKTRSGRAFISIIKTKTHVCPEIEIIPPTEIVSAFSIDPRGRVPSELAVLLATTVDGLPVCPAHNSSLYPGQVQNVSESLVPSEASPGLDPSPRKTVSFDTHRDVRLFALDSTVNEHRDFSQVCTDIENHVSELTPKTYLMANICSIDHSLREVFYKAYFTSPLANLLAEDEELNDFYY